MMRDEFLQKKRRFEPSRIPIIKEYTEEPSNLDPELRKLRHVMVRPTSDNREYCFWNSSLAQSFTYITASTIIGDGLRIKCKNRRAQELIEDFNTEINVNGKSIEDYITSSWIDEIVHANSYWRIQMTKETPTGVDIQRIDPKTVVKYKDPKYGYVKLIQRIGNFKAYRSKAAFYSQAKLTDNNLTGQYPYTTREVHIPDEPDVLLRTSFFIRPPISSATHYIAYKRFILYFMRKYSQRLWAPFLLFLVGNPRTNYYPDTDMEMQQAIDDLSEIIPQMAGFGGAAIPGNTMIEEIGKNSARSSETFVHYIDALDKQIMMAIFGSMGLRDASGNELATSRNLREGFLQFVGGIRRKYQISFERFYTRCLLKTNGIRLSPREIDIEFPPLKFEPTEEYMRGIEIAVNSGVFKDRNEIRKASKVIWKWLDDLPAGQNTKVQFVNPSTNTADRVQEYIRRRI